MALVGCASSRIRFEEPTGTRLVLDANADKPGAAVYKFPIAINLPQRDNPAKAGSDDGGRPISMRLPDGTKLKGFLYVYRIKMDQVERLAEVTFSLTDDQILKLKKGYAVIVTGSSPRRRIIYKINLGIDR